MRDFAELNINEGGKSVGRPAPTEELVREFEINFAIKLPEEYLVLLKYSNGGGPELDTIQPIDRRDVGLWSINRFYYLDGRKIFPKICGMKLRTGDLSWAKRLFHSPKTAAVISFSLTLVPHHLV